MPSDLAAPRILVVNPFGIGDVVFSFSLVSALIAVRPDAEIDFLCNERTQALAAMNPMIRRVHEFNRDRFRTLLKNEPGRFFSEAAALWRAVKSQRYDVVFDLSMGREYAFFLALCGVPRRIGFDYKGRGFFLTERVPLENYDGRAVRETVLSLVERWVPGVTVLGGYPRLRTVRAGWDEWSTARGIHTGDFVVAVAPGGGKSWGENAPYKQWAPDRFARVAAAMAQTKNARVIVIGDGGENELCDKVRHLAGAPGIENMVGEPLPLVIEALRHAGLFIGNDGGLLHLADLVGTPLVGIYGPVDERTYGPRHRPGARTVTRAVSCRPCYAGFRFPPCAHNKRCLEELEVGEVLAAAEHALAAQPHA